MADTDRPQIYLITPPELDLSIFPDRLAHVLDRVEIACIRLHLPSGDEERVARAADALREIAHARDVSIVIQDHVQLVGRLGLDGVHLVNGARNLRKVRKDLGTDAIVGAFCGASRHDGMGAAEAGADYVSFGPVTATPLGDGTVAPRDLFEWWSEMIEIPLVAEGGFDGSLLADLALVTDFVAIGEEIWSNDDPAAELGRLVSMLG